MWFLLAQAEEGHCGPDVILPTVPHGSSIHRVDVVRVRPGGRETSPDAVAVERALEVRIGGEPFSVIMRTPGADRELAAGFLFSEGVIAEQADVLAIDTSVIDHLDVTLSEARAAVVDRQRSMRRQVTMTSSCGMCGRPTIESTMVVAAPVNRSLAVSAALISSLPARLMARQEAFVQTGGLHGAALVSVDGEILESAEDVGRHNAVDKIIGRQVLAGLLPAAGALLFVSGRTSFEIVQKAWLAGIPIVAAVSAPSSLAIDLATSAGITLIGFVRGDRFNVYAHAERVMPESAAVAGDAPSWGGDR
jgi:FdhD protein